MEPIANAESKLPGEIEIAEALLVAQLRVLLEPLVMLVGLAAKEEIDGMEDPAGGFELVEALPHPDRSAHSAKKSSGNVLAKRFRQSQKCLQRKELNKVKRRPSGWCRSSSLVIAYFRSYWPEGQNRHVDTENSNRNGSNQGQGQRDLTGPT